MKTLYLYSPILPIKSGTAHYFGLFMDQVRGGSYTDDYEIVVVVDKKFYTVEQLKDVPYHTMDFHDVTRTRDDISVYFLANNEFHRYAHRAVYDHRPKDGLAVSVVHEPCMWMNVQAMCNLREYDFREEDLEYFARYEFGADTPFMYRLFQKGEVDKNFEYTSLAGTHIYEHSDIIIFHSQFALQKFMLERSATYVTKRTVEPTCFVMQHPPEHGLVTHSERAEKKKFIAGTYGWVKQTKQVSAIIQAFDTFYTDLSAEDQENVSLDIVGQLDLERGFDPVAEAQATTAHANVRFFGYVTNEMLDDLISQASIVFSLRFPSCGETSGPLYKANALGIPVALSDYAAFAEEPADYHVPVERTLQHAEIVKILHKEFQAFKLGKRAQIHTLAHGVGMSVDQALDKVLRFKDNLTVHG